MRGQHCNTVGQKTEYRRYPTHANSMHNSADAVYCWLTVHHFQSQGTTTENGSVLSRKHMGLERGTIRGGISSFTACFLDQALAKPHLEVAELEVVLPRHHPSQDRCELVYITCTLLRFLAGLLFHHRSADPTCFVFLPQLVIPKPNSRARGTNRVSLLLTCALRPRNLVCQVAKLADSSKSRRYGKGKTLESKCL